MSDDPKPADPAAVAEPEPEGVVEVQGKRLVPVDAIVAERERARTKAEEKYKTELEPLKQKAAQADQLASDLAALKPQLDYVRANWEQIQAAQKKATDIPDVSDEDAEKFARRYELYRDNGLDVHRAKQMIVDQRAETKRIASQVAQEAVAPYAQTAAAHAARENFMWAANQKAPDGSPLVDPGELAAVWRTFPPELSADPGVAKVILEAAIGRTVRSGKRVPAPSQEPVYSEAPGGGPHGDYRISPLERSVARVAGMDEKKFAESAKQYKPDAVNILGD